jgi:alpha-glucosidase
VSSWWRDAVIYQVYVRSFQDSDGDGIGDLRGVRARLDHLERLGVDAVWLSPICPSPNADYGYDVADYTAVDPQFGTLADFDALLAEVHERGMRLLLDFVPCHTSIAHRWFTEHPDWYIWVDDGPPNNWVAAFGGPAWSLDERRGRWYLHSFFPEQADLDWRNPEVVAAMQGAMRFWLDRGVDGFRVDAIDRLLKDRELRDDPPATRRFPLPLAAEHDRFEHRYSRNDPEVGTALAALREAAGDRLLIGEVYLPTADLGPYLEHLDVAFCFELLHAPPQPAAIRPVIEEAEATGKAGWVVSNHDFSRLATRAGAANTAIGAMLLLTLPGPTFVYQGDEIGMADGPMPDPPLDRAGRDPFRTPMQWEPGARGGFTTGTPWLPLADRAGASVAEQEHDNGSLLTLYRRLIELRRTLGAGLRFLESAESVLAYERGGRAVALNFGEQPAEAPPVGELLLATPGAEPGRLAPHSGWVAACSV